VDSVGSLESVLSLDVVFWPSDEASSAPPPQPDSTGIPSNTAAAVIPNSFFMRWCLPWSLVVAGKTPADARRS
jgi:hypothetical protein